MACSALLMPMCTCNRGKNWWPCKRASGCSGLTHSMAHQPWHYGALFLMPICTCSQGKNWWPCKKGSGFSGLTHSIVLTHALCCGGWKWNVNDSWTSQWMNRDNWNPLHVWFHVCIFMILFWLNEVGETYKAVPRPDIKWRPFLSNRVYESHVLDMNLKYFLFSFSITWLLSLNVRTDL